MPRRAPAACAAVAAAALLPLGARGAELTAQERAGKQIYLRGESPTGAGISAAIGGDTILPGTAVACAGCHGSDGLGRPEGGADPGPVLWSHLAKRYGHVHDGSRRHPAFTPKTLARAIRGGVDPAGNPLAPAMPRYSISSEDLDSLVVYLRRLEHDADPGVSAAAVRIGTVLPARGSLAPAGKAMRGVLERTLAALNGSGGLHGRRLELVAGEFDPQRESGLAAAKRLAARGDVFALVAGLAPGAEREIEALAESERIPLVGPVTPFTGGAEETQVFHVGPGVEDQARVLARWAAERGIAPGTLAILHGEGEPLARAAEAVRAELATRGAAAGGEPEVLGHARGALDPAVAGRLAAAGFRAVLFLGADADLAAFARAAAAEGFAPDLLLAGALSSRAAVELPGAFEGKVHLAYATLPSDERGPGAARFAAARALSGSGEAHRTIQASAYAAAAVLAEGMRRAGRHLTRERLVESLEGLFRYETGVGPPITFGPRRRVGAHGAYVVALDLAARTFRPVSGWIALD